jgi:hypothetical protein
MASPRVDMFQKLVAHLKSPFLLQESVVKFFEDRGLNISQQKVLATLIRQNSQAVVGLTNAAFFTGTLNPSNGSTNMKQFIPSEGEHMLITAIRCLDGAAATFPTTDWQDGVGDATTKNGKFSISVNRTVRLADTPLTVFGEVSTDPDNGYLILDEPILWPGQQELIINVAWDTVPATANQNLRFELSGIGLI